MKETTSRGKRNRIKKKLAKLNGTAPPETLVSKSKEESKSDNAEESQDNEQTLGQQVELSKETQKLLKMKNMNEDEVMEEEIKKEIKKNKKKRKQRE